MNNGYNGNNGNGRYDGYPDEIRPGGSRPAYGQDDRPSGSRPYGTSESGSARPSGSRPYGTSEGGSARPSGARPYGTSEGGSARPFGSRPYGTSEGGSARPSGARPAASRQGNASRPARPSRKPASQGASRRGQGILASGRGTGEDDEEKLPITVYLGIAVTALALIILLVSVVSDVTKKKNRYSNLEIDGDPVQSDVSDVVIDDETDDWEEDDVASVKENAIFQGTWYKTDVDTDQRATLTVSMQYADSFEFSYQVWSGKNSKTVSNTAFYTDETHAEYSPKKNVKLIFERTEEGVTITHKGSNSALGFTDKYKIDGKFNEIEPELPEDEPTGSYDYYLYQSDAIVKALKETLSDDDYALYQDMMENGLMSPIDYERTTDKNGNPVNVDEELNAVKYYAHLSSREYDMIFICSENANIYVLFYNSDEVIYCTNDRNYYKKMPASFQAVADSKGVKPTFR